MTGSVKPLAHDSLSNLHAERGGFETLGVVYSLSEVTTLDTQP